VHSQTDHAQEIETGIVTDLQDGNAIVQLNLQAACESCGAKVLCVPDQNGKRLLRVSNSLNAQIGERVAISESGDFLLKVSAIQYGIPFIGFLLGIFLFYFLNLNIANIPAELIYFIGGLIGLGLSALISRKAAQNMAESNRSFFAITKIIQS
jgi:positive regulator of sigma E activity